MRNIFTRVHRVYNGGTGNFPITSCYWIHICDRNVRTRTGGHGCRRFCVGIDFLSCGRMACVHAVNNIIIKTYSRRIRKTKARLRRYNTRLLLYTHHTGRISLIKRTVRSSGRQQPSSGRTARRFITRPGK